MLVPPCSQFNAVLPLAVSWAIATKKFSSVLLISSCHCWELLESSYYAEYIYIFFFIFSQILGLSLDFSRMTSLLVATEPFPKIGHNFGLCSLPYVLQFSIVLLENPLHSTNISWNSPYCSPSVISANLTDKCYLQKFGSGSEKSSLPTNLCLNLHSQLS